MSLLYLLANLYVYEGGVLRGCLKGTNYITIFFYKKKGLSHRTKKFK